VSTVLDFFFVIFPYATCVYFVLAMAFLAATIFAR